MGSCCGKDKEDNDKSHEKYRKNPTSPSIRTVSPPKSPTSLNNSSKDVKEKSETSTSQKSKKGPLFKSDIEDNDTEEKKLIEDEKLEKQMKQSVRGGESAYGKVVPKKGKNNESKDFIITKQFLASRQYQIIDSIGSGNYAEVYKAFHSERNKFVAVKVIDLQKANHNYRVNFLPREITILKQLKHPAIIKIYEISQTVNKIFMIMEFAHNGTVADWLRDKGSFSEVTAWQMFRRILESLHYMHSLQMAHRDLKLENILITEKLNPKLSDFSYAVTVDDKYPLSTTFCGSLPYFAPEIMQRKPYNPLASDIWSLGVCLYVMINDGLPFKISDERAMLYSQLNKDWDFKKRVEAKLSPEVKAMVRKMLDPNTTTRATTLTLMKDPWITTHPKPIE